MDQQGWRRRGERAAGHHHIFRNHTVGPAHKSAGKCGGVECVCGQRFRFDVPAERNADRDRADLDTTRGASDNGEAGDRWTGPELSETGSKDTPEGLMTAKLGSAITAKIIQRITGPAGVNSSLATLTAADNTPGATLDAAQVRAQNVAPDLVERSRAVHYPAVNVYCEKIVNALTEKFRRFSGSAQMSIEVRHSQDGLEGRFSGSAQMSIEVRHSQDGLEGLQDALELYTDAVAQTLNACLGDWGGGMYYGGGYQVSFGAAQHGGKNFIQTAKITFEIGVSRN